jgi:Fic family protein
MHYTTPDVLHKMCSIIDRNSAGSIQANEPAISSSDRDFYIFKSLVDESITSSQLEGASTTREVAKEMIRTGRQPMDKSERMIYNNYQAMLFIRQIKDLPLTPEIIFDIHRTITEGTLDNPEAAGRQRHDDEDVRVYDDVSGEILHTPPAAGELRARMKAMCAFANDIESNDFIHPVVRAILIHFWLAYDHPFVDGNGRTARALFYWAMARQKYWLFEFISISQIIHEGPAKYARSFLYTETDDHDITYFLLNQFSVILRAIDELHKYLRRKETELMEVQDVLAKTRLAAVMFNHRQMAIINHGLKHANAVYTTESHRRSHNVSPQTARTDLLELAEHGLLLKHQRGRAYVFIAPGNLKSRIVTLAAPEQTGAAEPGRPSTSASEE